MFIYVVRHAWAGHFGDPGWADDSLRELTLEGIDRFERVAAALVDRGFAAERIATSPYIRCRQTAEILASALPDSVDVVELDALQPGSDFDSLLEWSAQQDCDAVAWVGHAPDVSYFVNRLIGAGAAEVRFAKAACSAVLCDRQLTVGQGELYWHVTAKMLGC